MLLTLWNYLRGYVIIRVSGFSVERFINMAVHKKIYIWDLKHNGNYVVMKVSLNGFKHLKPFARKTKCHIRILEKRGYPFFTYKYRKRYIFAMGLFSFIVLMYILSSFIWLIEINGNQRIDSNSILSFCKNNGLENGSWKFKIDKKELEKKMKDNFSDLSWIAINIKGTKAIINVTETLPKLVIPDYSIPCDIIARCDGLITSIYTNKGTPLVKAKDVVEKGEVLVSGRLKIKDDETGTVTDYVHSSADIKAKISYEIKFNIPFNYTIKNYTQNIKNTYEMLIFDKNVKLNFLNKDISFKNYDRIISRKQLSAGKDFILPCIIIKNTYREYIPEYKTYSYEEAKKIAEKKLTSKIIEQIDVKSDIIDKDIEYTKSQNGLEIRATVSVIENIGIETEIKNTVSEGSNTTNGTTKNTNTE